MPKVDSNLAMIIPTKNRPHDLRFLLDSISAQDMWPAQIIIVDAGQISCENILKDFEFFDIFYKKTIPSLTMQRNQGIGLLKENIDVVAFLDDDIILCLGAVKTAVNALRGLPDTCGVCCNNLSHKRPKASILEKIFLVASDDVGVVMKSGFQSKICSLDKDYYVRWLIGGATFWKRSVFNDNRFDEWYYGYGHCEDLDFSYKLGKSYKLLALKEAAFTHNIKDIILEHEYYLGRMQVANRVYFVRKYREFSIFLSYWSFTGLLLKNIFVGVVCFKPKYLSRAAGVFSGILVSFFRHDRIKEGIKS